MNSEIENVDILLANKASRYHLNDFILDEWNINSSWFFGWLLTDGGISGDRISFFLRDEEVLLKIKAVLNGEFSVYAYKCHNHINCDLHPFYKIQFSSHHIVQKLATLGITEPKTGKIPAPVFIPKEYHRDFIRGAWEGDGGIYLRTALSQTYPQASCDFNNSSKELIDWMFNTLKETLNIKLNISTYRNTNFKLRIRNRVGCIKFCRYIYHENIGTTFLTRKYIVAKTIMQNKY